MRPLRCLSLGIAGVLLCAGTAYARIVEEQIDVPVHVQDRFGKHVAQDIRVTVFHDDAVPAPYAVVVLNHGRATSAEQRAAMGRARYSEASRWLAQRGFLVAVPTRIGYGVSGGEDVEDSGACNRRQYEPAYRAAADQTLRVVEAMLQRPDVRKDRTVLIGQSFGGATTLAAASLQPTGLVAAINFAGGGGGDPERHPGDPCSAERMGKLYASYAPTIPVQTLWVYTENDLFFGAEHPRRWAQAFREAGGRVEFVQFPPHGKDGHSLFAQFPAVWQPVVADYLRRQGFDFKD